jgi:hypothetical protein
MTNVESFFIRSFPQTLYSHNYFSTMVSKTSINNCAPTNTLAYSNPLSVTKKKRVVTFLSSFCHIPFKYLSNRPAYSAAELNSDRKKFYRFGGRRWHKNRRVVSMFNGNWPKKGMPARKENGAVTFAPTDTRLANRR